MDCTQDKTGRRGVTYRLHFVMQQDTAEFDAEESYLFRERLTRQAAVLPGGLANESLAESESASSRYGAKHRTTIIGAVVESVEDK